MKLVDIIHEDVESEKHVFKQWLNACREHFPNCTVTGDYSSGAQAVDWMSKNNEVAGDWKEGRGVVYVPGSQGKEVADTISVDDAVVESAGSRTEHPATKTIANKLKNGYGHANYRSAVTGNTHTIKQYDNADDYRCGAMKARTLSNLLHLIDKAVK